MEVFLNGISKSFGDKSVLRDFTYSFAAGGRYAVKGGSGSGKTTLLNIIMGLVTPDKGGIVIDEGRIGVVFQEDRLLEWTTALKNLEITGADTALSMKLLKKLQVFEPGKTVGDYSGGMKRRVAIARALAVYPDILILDEPFKGLDENIKRLTMKTVKEYSQDALLIFVTHDIAETEYFGCELINL